MHEKLQAGLVEMVWTLVQHLYQRCDETVPLNCSLTALDLTSSKVNLNETLNFKDFLEAVVRISFARYHYYEGPTSSCLERSFKFNIMPRMCFLMGLSFKADKEKKRRSPRARRPASASATGSGTGASKTLPETDKIDCSCFLSFEEKDESPAEQSRESAP